MEIDGKIVSEDLRITEDFDTTSGVPLFLVAGRGNWGTFESIYRIMRQYPPIFHEILLQINRQDTSIGVSMKRDVVIGHAQF